MMTAFAPDIFSAPFPLWIKSPDQTLALLLPVIQAMPGCQGLASPTIEQSGSLEINSSNFRVSAGKDLFLLKRWPASATIESITRTLQLIEWLAAQNVPVAAPGRFTDGSLIGASGDAHYSFFEFVDAPYFTGDDDQLAQTAHASARMTTTLQHTPAPLTTNGPVHMSDEDHTIMAAMKDSRARWPDIFGTSQADWLNAHWDMIEACWTKLRSTPPIAGPRAMVHYDLHPHNILMEGDTVRAFLDFDSCKLMPIGYGAAFGALKQCRQSVSRAATKDKAAIRACGDGYMRIIDQYFPTLTEEKNNFCRLAQSEVLRRLCYIFRQNLSHNNRQWNHVLPLQITHLYECESLFAD